MNFREGEILWKFISRQLRSELLLEFLCHGARLKVVSIFQLVIALSILNQFAKSKKSKSHIFSLTSKNELFLILLLVSTPILEIFASINPNIISNSLFGTSLANAFSTLLCMAIGFFCFAMNLVSRNATRIPTSFVLMTLFLLFAAISGVVLNQSFIGSLSALAIMFFATSLNLESFSLMRVVLISKLSLFTSFLVVLSINPNILVDCRLDKCLVFSQSIDNRYGGNSLGLTIALISILSLFFIQSIWRLLLTIVIDTIVLFIPGSRTAIVGYLFVSTCFIILYTTRSPKMRRYFAYTLMLIAFIISLFPIFGSYGESSFTRRGILWKVALRLVSEQSVIGYGPSFWSYQKGSGGFDANYGTHNIWLDYLVGFGIVGTFLLFLTVLLILRNSNREVGILLTSTLLVMGTTESILLLWRPTIAIGFFTVFYVQSLRPELRFRIGCHIDRALLEPPISP